MGSGNLFCEQDSLFFRQVAKDLNEYSGATMGETFPDGSVKYAVNLYQMDKSANFDPWYQEADATKDPVFRGPFNLPVPVEFEEEAGHYSQSPEDGGVEREYDGIAWVDRDSWEAEVVSNVNPGYSEPHEGDVLSMFESDPNSVRWFDVQRVERFGYVVTSNLYTGWKLTLMSRSSFDPSRRMTKQGG